MTAKRNVNDAASTSVATPDSNVNEKSKKTAEVAAEVSTNESLKKRKSVAFEDATPLAKKTKKGSVEACTPNPTGEAEKIAAEAPALSKTQKVDLHPKVGWAFLYLDFCFLFYT